MSTKDISLGQSIAARPETNAHVTLPTQPQQFPEPLALDFEDFSGGYNVATSEQNTPPNASPYTIDMLVDSSGKLARLPGITSIESLSQIPTSMLTHPSLDETTELILFAPPLLGIKRGDEVVWYDKGLRTGGLYQGAVYGQTLVFSNGRAVTYQREPNETGARVVRGFPSANVLTTYAQRVVALSTVIGGNFEPMGVWWTGPQGVEDIGIYSGFQLLISDTPEADEVLAATETNDGILAVMCRRSIWIGRQTGILEAPIDFQQRIRGTGIFARRTLQSTPVGALCLSEDGVRLFNGNTFDLVSQQINKHLLPIDSAARDNYTSYYDAGRNWYFLHTPDGTWILDLVYGRWYRSSAVVDEMVGFPEQQSGALDTWATIQGTWAAQILTWAQLNKPQGRARILARSGDTLGELLDGELGNFSIPMEPQWTTPKPKDQQAQMLYTFTDLEVEYSGSGRITLMIPDQWGTFVSHRGYDLEEGLPGIVATLNKTCLGAAMRVRVDSGDIRISRLALRMLPRSRKLRRV